MASFLIKVPVFFLQFLDIFVTLGRVFKITDDDFYYLYVLADMICILFCGKRAFAEDEDDVEEEEEEEEEEDTGVKESRPAEGVEMVDV